MGLCKYIGISFQACKYGYLIFGSFLRGILGVLEFTHVFRMIDSVFINQYPLAVLEPGSSRTRQTLDETEDC